MQSLTNPLLFKNEKLKQNKLIGYSCLITLESLKYDSKLKLLNLNKFLMY